VDPTGGNEGNEKGAGSPSLIAVVTGIVATIVGSVVVFMLTREGGPLNPPKPTTTTRPSIAEAPPLAGEITDVQLSRGRPCCTYSVQVHLLGFKSQPCMVKTTIIDAASGNQGRPGTGPSFVPESNDDQATQEITVPIPRSGNFMVRFILYDPKGVELDRLDRSQVVTP
jgi:hypothetical protein